MSGSHAVDWPGRLRGPRRAWEPKGLCAPPRLPVAVISATCECPAALSAGNVHRRGHVGECHLRAGPPRICAVPTWALASSETQELQRDNWPLLPGPLPSGHDARAVLQDPGQVSRLLSGFLPPRGKPLHCLTAFETDQTGESWLTAKTSLFSLRVFGGGTSDGPSVPWDAGDGRGCSKAPAAGSQG